MGDDSTNSARTIPTAAHWGAWLETLRWQQTRVQTEVEDRKVRETFEATVNEQFRLGVLQLDDAGRVIPGTTAYREDPDFQETLLRMASMLQGLIGGPVLLLSTPERLAIAAHLEAGHIVLFGDTYPLPAAACPNYPAAAVLSAYLDLALECIALMTGRPRLVGRAAVIRLVQDWPNVLDLLGMEEQHAHWTAAEP